MRDRPIPMAAEISDISDVRDFWLLLKPNVMSLVVFSAGVGLYVAPGRLHPVLAAIAVLCITIAAGAAAAINNSYDADIDRIMARTRKRPTAQRRISPADALAYGVTLGVFSVIVMGLAINWVAASLLALTIGFYVVVYTMWLKRRTPQNIVIGGAAGALPPMIGWAAVTGDISLPPIILFAIIFCWTPPHFWSLALYRTKDYAAAGVPMLPVTAGSEVTRRHILAYTLILVPVSLLPMVFGDAGALYGTAAIGLGFGFVGHAVKLWRDGTQQAASRNFRFSLIYLFGVFAALVVDHTATTFGLARIWEGG